MAFPVRAATAGTTSAGNTTHTVNLPASISAGNGLLISINIYAGSVTLTTPAGWDQRATAGTNYYVFTKTASGSEGATVAITASGVSSILAIAERYTGVSGNVEAATGVSSLNVPALTPSWGAKDTLWVTSLSSNIGVSGDNDSVPPTDYGNPVERASGFVGIMSAYRELNATSEDPGSWTQPNGGERTTLIAWEPEAVAGGGAINMLLMGVG